MTTQRGVDLGVHPVLLMLAMGAAGCEQDASAGVWAAAGVGVGGIGRCKASSSSAAAGFIVGSSSPPQTQQVFLSLCVSLSFSLSPLCSCVFRV